MDLGDSNEALRAEAGRARRQAEKLKDEARDRRARAAQQVETAERVKHVARALAPEDEDPTLHCPRCNAIWRRDAVREEGGREAGCLLCGGPLVPSKSD